MRPEHHSAPAGTSRHPSAHRPTTDARDVHAAHGHGRADKPSPAFDPNDTDGFSHILRTLPLTLGVTVMTGLALVTVSAAIAIRAPDPVALILPLAYISAGLASLLGGILSGRRHPSAPLAAGFVCGALISLFLTIMGLCMGGTDLSAGVWLLRLGVIPVHLLGAYLARPREKPAAHGSHTPGRHSGR